MKILLLASTLLPVLPAPAMAQGATTPARPAAEETLQRPPYDLSAAVQLLESELDALDGNVAVLVHQDGKELFRFQAGAIDFDTQVPLASLTKTLSAAVVLALVEEGAFDVEETLGAAFPLTFGRNGIGDATLEDCFGMRHGIDTRLPYERMRRFDLQTSVFLIGTMGQQVFPPATQLCYDGAGMQAVGRLAEVRTGQSWIDIARSRVLEPCGMPGTDYGHFDPNPAIAGGGRSSAGELARFARMVLGGGSLDGRRVLSPESVETLFSNRTRDLPVFHSPWPASSPGYPYGEAPDYAFGAWVFAEHPDTAHVEELVGAGAFGSYLWLDQRRGLSALLVTEIPAGSAASMPAATGLFGILRDAVEGAQVDGLSVDRGESRVHLSWARPAGSAGSRVYGAEHPIRDLFDLRSAERLSTVPGTEATVRSFPHYAVTAVFGQGDGFENTALVPGINTTD